MIEVKEVKTLSELKKFVKFPFKLYSDNPYWVPPLLYDELNTLRADKNPAFDHCEAKCWLAYKDGKIAGRIAGIMNKTYIEKWGLKHGRFGWIDFIDDLEVSKALFETAENWAKSKGLNGIHGPLGFCDLDKEGMLVEGFDEPSMFITIYNYPYYKEHLEKLGYIKDTDWIEFEVKVPDQIPEKVEKLTELVIKRSKFQIVKVKKSRELLPYAEDVFNLLNDAYKELYGVVPLSDRQIKAYVKQYFGFLNPEFVRVVLDDSGKIAAFGIAMPSLSNAAKKAKGRLFPLGFIHVLRAIKKNDRLDLYLIAVRPDLQGKGVNALLMTEINKSAIELGYKFAETGPELEDNTKVQALWKHFETRQHKRRRCYIKKFDA